VSIRYQLLSPLAPSAAIDITLSNIRFYSNATVNIIASPYVTAKDHTDHYELLIIPQPPAQPATFVVPTVFKVTLDYNVPYMFVVTSVNSCSIKSSFNKVIRIGKPVCSVEMIISSGLHKQICLMLLLSFQLHRMPCTPQH
jgi:hypothetical protein